jgi:5-deoxy-glucuronate isomerase
MSSLLIKPNLQRRTGEFVTVTPQSAGWENISLAVVRLEQSDTYDFCLDREEAVIVVLGGKIDVTAAGQKWTGLGERADVFSGMPWSLYLPVNSSATITGCTGTAEFAVCRCKAARAFPPRVIAPQDVEIEIRGGENATRQINNMVLGGFPCDRILVVEVYTPSGNWSSYPPHKHDLHNPPGEVDLEEIYYYKLSKPEGYAIQRVYTKDGRRDETITVRDNEVVLIPEGYHPVVAAFGYDCYYLNVLGGSAHAMSASDDPDYAWVRESWKVKDPRLPLVKN